MQNPFVGTMHFTDNGSESVLEGCDHPLRRGRGYGVPISGQRVRGNLVPLQPLVQSRDEKELVIFRKLITSSNSLYESRRFVLTIINV